MDDPGSRWTLGSGGRSLPAEIGPLWLLWGARVELLLRLVSGTISVGIVGNSVVRGFSRAQGRRRGRLQRPTPPGHSTGIPSRALCPDGRNGATGAVRLVGNRRSEGASLSGQKWQGRE